MKSGALVYLAFEIGALFLLGGLFYLFKRKKYIKYHHNMTIDFINRIKKVSPQSLISNDPKQFELSFLEKYKEEKNLLSYSEDEQEIYSEYIDYIEGISGPIL